MGRGSSPVELQTWEILKYFSYFIIYCVNGWFWGTVLSGCFIILSTLFILNLTWKESFLESTLSGWTFGKYLVLHQLLIKHQLCNWTRPQNHLVLKGTLNHLAKWLSVRLRTKWLQSLHLQISRLLRARSSFTFRQL